MSLYDYQCSQKIKKGKYSIGGIIMAAMERADYGYRDALISLFPSTYEEFMKRNNAVGGKLEEEKKGEGK